MKSTYLLLGLTVVFALCLWQTNAAKCGQTDCDENKGGYCCAEDSSSTTKDCCCTGIRPTNYTIECTHVSSFPIWAIVIIILVVLGIVGGVAAWYFIRRRRLMN